MLPKAPKRSSGQEGIEAYRARLHDRAASLRNRVDREFYRKGLASRAKLYGSLRERSEPDGNAARHFDALALLHWKELDAFGPEPAPRRRPRRASVPLSYPNFAQELSLRVHFFERGSLRRERSAAIAVHADAVSRQTASNGDSVLSVAVAPDQGQFFERLIESIGQIGLYPSRGFDGYLRTDGCHVPGSGWDDSQSPWRQIRDDNAQARLYHWSLAHVDPPIPVNRSSMPVPWDPDPRFAEILSLTQTDRLAEALALVEKIPPSEREILFDEVIYLRYLVGQTPRADDIRNLARKYAAGSTIRLLIEEAFEAFLDCLDQALAESPLNLDDVFGFDADILQRDPDPLNRSRPPLIDWAATRAHYARQLAAYGYPVQPRGRIFVWHPDIASGSLRWLQRMFEPEMVAAENAFRRARTIPEIGRGWASEAAFVEVVRSICPDAIHQWRPRFLGSLSVDVYVPSMRLAIEYQGEQHYRPVAIFGGEEGFAAARARDALKRRLLQVNGVELLEWHHGRPIAEVETALASLWRRSGMGDRSSSSTQTRVE